MRCLDTRSAPGHFNPKLGPASAILLASILGAGLLASPPEAVATEIPPFGASGDAGAKDLCPAGQFVVGLRARSGSWMDQISLTCAPLKPDGSLGPHWHGPERGGNGGGPSGKSCKAGHIVRGIGLLMTAGNRQVRRFTLDCRSTTSTERYSLDIGNDATVFASVQQSCPLGEAATGMQVRFGKHVNAAGLVCGKLPAKPSPGSTSTTPTTPTTPSSNVPADWADMLKAHNDKRALHCVGALAWSAQLAADAQAYANQCKIGIHGSTGESLADFTAWRESNGVKTPILPATSNANAFQNAWYCEIKNYDFDNPKFSGGSTQNCNPPVNGHFTQVVWKDTRQLGCGKATCTINGQQGTHWVCRYSPPGNFNVQDPNVLKAQVLRPRCK